MRLVALSAALLGAAIIFAGSGQSVSAETDQKPQPEVNSNVIVVKSGDTLSRIAKDNDTTYQRIFYANKIIEDPDLIYPDSRLRIPANDEILAERALPSRAPAPAPGSYGNAIAPRTNYAPRSQPAPAPSDAGISGGVWDSLAACESGGNWAINTGNGFYGGLQFTLSSWRAAGGQGYPNQASKSEQIARAKILQSRQGWGAWPACTAKLGIR